MRPKATTPSAVPRVCEQCGQIAKSFRRGVCQRCYDRGRNAVKVKTPEKTAALMARNVSIRARNRSFIDAVNSQTICAKCGCQPIQWHNPEHVALGRQKYRIGNMASSTYSLLAIRAELARCTPLCARCHMHEDGPHQPHIQHRPRQHKPPMPCVECGKLWKYRRRGLCGTCDARRRYRLKNRSALCDVAAAVSFADGDDEARPSVAAGEASRP
jgi:hypothetical protein